MIFASPVPMEVGKVHIPFAMKTFDGGVHYGQPCFVLREATREEWIADVAQNTGCHNTALGNAATLLSWNVPIFFYEVSLD